MSDYVFNSFDREKAEPTEGRSAQPEGGKKKAASQNPDIMEGFLEKMDSESHFKKNQIVTATISKATEDGLQILLPFSKKEIALNKADLDCETYDPAAYEARIGETIDLLVVDPHTPIKLSEKMIRLLKEEDFEKMIRLLKEVEFKKMIRLLNEEDFEKMIRLLKEEESRADELKSGKEFQMRVTGYYNNPNGLSGSYGTYSVFVPANEIRITGNVLCLSKYIGSTLRLRAIEIRTDSRKKEVIASQRVIFEEEQKKRDAVSSIKGKEGWESAADRDTEVAATENSLTPLNGSNIKIMGSHNCEDVRTINANHKIDDFLLDEIRSSFKENLLSPYVLHEDRIYNVFWHMIPEAAMYHVVAYLYYRDASNFYRFNYIKMKDFSVDRDTCYFTIDKLVGNQFLFKVYAEDRKGNIISKTHGISAIK